MLALMDFVVSLISLYLSLISVFTVVCINIVLRADFIIVPAMAAFSLVSVFQFVNWDASVVGTPRRLAADFLTDNDTMQIILGNYECGNESRLYWFVYEAIPIAAGDNGFASRNFINASVSFWAVFIVHFQVAFGITRGLSGMRVLSGTRVFSIVTK